MIYAIQAANPNNLSKPTTTIKMIGGYLLDPTFANLDAENESLGALDTNPNVAKERSFSAIGDVFQDRIIQNQMASWIGACILGGITIYLLDPLDQISVHTLSIVTVTGTILLICTVIGYFAYQAKKQGKPRSMDIYQGRYLVAGHCGEPHVVCY